MLLHVCHAKHITLNLHSNPFSFIFLLLCFILSQTCCSCYLIPIKPDRRSYASYVWPGFCWIHYGAHFVFLLLLCFKGQFHSFHTFSVVCQMGRLSYCVQLSSALRLQIRMRTRWATLTSHSAIIRIQWNQSCQQLLEAGFHYCTVTQCLVCTVMSCSLQLCNT